jgi:hypothetical protein
VGQSSSRLSRGRVATLAEYGLSLGVLEARVGDRPDAGRDPVRAAVLDGRQRLRVVRATADMLAEV